MPRPQPILIHSLECMLSSDFNGQWWVKHDDWRISGLNTQRDDANAYHLTEHECELIAEMLCALSEAIRYRDYDRMACIIGTRDIYVAKDRICWIEDILLRAYDIETESRWTNHETARKLRRKLNRGEGGPRTRKRLRRAERFENQDCSSANRIDTLLSLDAFDLGRGHRNSYRDEGPYWGGVWGDTWNDGRPACIPSSPVYVPPRNGWYDVPPAGWGYPQGQQHNKGTGSQNGGGRDTRFGPRPGGRVLPPNNRGGRGRGISNNDNDAGTPQNDNAAQSRRLKVEPKTRAKQPSGTVNRVDIDNRRNRQRSGSNTSTQSRSRSSVKIPAVDQSPGWRRTETGRNTNTGSRRSGQQSTNTRSAQSQGIKIKPSNNRARRRSGG